MPPEKGFGWEITVVPISELFLLIFFCSSGLAFIPQLSLSHSSMGAKKKRRFFGFVWTKHVRSFFLSSGCKWRLADNDTGKEAFLSLALSNWVFGRTLWFFAARLKDEKRWAVRQLVWGDWVYMEKRKMFVFLITVFCVSLEKRSSRQKKEKKIFEYANECKIAFFLLLLLFLRAVDLIFPHHGKRKRKKIMRRILSEMNGRRKTKAKSNYFSPPTFFFFSLFSLWIFTSCHESEGKWAFFRWDSSSLRCRFAHYIRCAVLIRATHIFLVFSPKILSGC